ncbi:MAG: ABC transporter permease, partial [Sporomusa sp.]
MPVFKTLMRVAAANISSIIVFVIVFIALSIAFSTITASDEDTMFEDSSYNICVLNRDGSALGEIIEEYLSNRHNIVTLDDDKETLQDALYYRTVLYILIIPEGFEDSFLSGGDMSLENIKAKQSTTGTVAGAFIDLQIDSYLSTVNTYLAAGFDTARATALAGEDLAETISVQIRQEQSEGINTSYFWYRFMPYATIGIMISIICPILLTFGKNDLRRRMSASSLSDSGRSGQVILGC